MFTRSGLSYDPLPVPTNDPITIDEDEEEAEEKAAKENPTQKPTKENNVQPIKPYTPKIPYPQALRKERR